MRLHIPVPLRWSDFDAYAHVNNAEMLRILEEARIQAFWLPDGGEVGEATAILDARPGAETISLIARQEIEYLAPIPYMRAPIDIELWIGRIGGASLEVCYEVCSPIETANGRLQTVYARATTVVVKVDATSGRPLRLTPGERAVWEPFLGEPIAHAHRR